MSKKFFATLVSFFFAPLTLLCVAFFYHNVLLTFLLLVIISSLAIIFNSNTRVALTLWLTATILGPLAEVFAIHFGAWHYALASKPLSIPIWLAPCWGLAGIFFYNLSKRLEDRLNK